MPVDFMYGSGSSAPDVAGKLMQFNMDPGALRPFASDDPRDPYTYLTLNETQPDGSVKPVTRIKDGPPVFNHPVANAYASDLGISTLRVREWIQLDQAVLEAARPELGFVNMLRSRGLEYSIPNGMGRTVLQYQAQTAPGVAGLSMDGLKRVKNDRPLYDLRSLPLPIAHEDFSFPIREIMQSRNNNTPLDLTMAKDSAIRVAELIERLALGTYGTYTYGGGVVYGLTNLPQRLTYTIANPTGGSWTPAQTLLDVQAMKQASMNDFHMGPWVLLCSFEWEQYLDGDFSAAYPNMTLRDRLKKINKIQDVVVLDFLTDYQMILVEMKDRTIREVIGMDLTTLQWPSEGGMEINFKIMAIMVPQPRYDYYENVGIVHGSVA